MSRVGYLLLLSLIWMGSQTVSRGQANATLEKPTSLSVAKKDDRRPDTSSSTLPKSLTFTASTDQRFFFFEDTRNDNNRRIPVSVYGVRAGFLFPPRRRRDELAGGRSASFKTGLGFYFVNQQLDQPGLLPNTSASVTRKLRIATAYYERYLLRRKKFEVSLPLELGYGHSRYERNDEQAGENEIGRGIFIPLGVGVSASYQFPDVRWLKPLHWFGFNVLTGYRFILKKDFPASQINYSGFYVSIGPSFFLENMTYDIKHWRDRHRQKKAQRRQGIQGK